MQQRGRLGTRIMESEGVTTAGESRWLEAMQWHEDLQETNEAALTQDRIHAWREWVADPENRKVFSNLSELLADGRLLRNTCLPELNQPQHPPNQISPPAPPQPLSADTAAAASPKAPSRRARISFVSAAAAVIVCGVFFASTKLRLHAEAGSAGADEQLHETGLGEVRTFSLPDGSSVTLGARSSISVQLERERRVVRLDRGEAWFHVARDSSRPFVVHAGRGTVTAVGTAFVVQRDADHVVVTVTDGAVQVASPPSNTPSFLTSFLSSAHPSVARVARGQQLTYGESGSATPVEHVDADVATAWSQGRLEFDHAPLSQVVAVVNRYTRRSISLDPAVDAQVFTGVILESEVDNWICGLEDIFPVVVVAEGEHTFIRPRRAEAVAPTSRCTDRH